MTRGAGLPDGFGLRLDPSLRRLEDGRILIGGSPLRILKLSAAGARVVDGWAAGGKVGTRPGAQKLARQLLDAGMAQPVPGPSPYSRDAVTVVIPVFDDPAGVLSTVALLGPVAGVSVVDDGSSMPIASIFDEAGPTSTPTVLVLRRPAPGGPGVARNVGLASVRTPLVAFVDADVRLPAGWLEPLLAHFADPAVVAVAPRVAFDGVGSRDLRSRFEAAQGPLDLGPSPGRVAPRTAVAYVPAAVLVARVDALRAAGGFDPGLRYGEDVDLVWRLAGAGGIVRYEPAVTARHLPRPNWAAWARQRFSYGTAAAPLAKRHPGMVPPLQVSAWSAAAWVAAGLGNPLLGAALAGGSTALLPRKLEVLADPGREALRLAGLGHLHAGRWIARAITRTWWPLAVILALLSKRARPALLAAVVAPAFIDWRAKRPDLDPVRYIALRLADDVAYGAGVWAGCWRTRSAAPLRPDLSSWPGRRAASATGRGGTPPADVVPST